MSIENNPYPKGSPPWFAWLEGHLAGYTESHKDHMKAMDKMLPKTADDMKEFYETEFKKLEELEEARRNNKIM
ncbi:unnamed protein product [marine sediment metagenome]|uniref:Uncharacterized protein n=1 Tax=marine sediment metagenome TaxID=412755 RepID=X1KBI6_9ZZZZ